MIKIGRLDKKKIFEIRMRYEYGENLKDLALEYKVPEITLKKRKSKDSLRGDPWIKGFRAKLSYEDYIGANENKKRCIEEKITNQARDELLLLNSKVREYYDASGEIVNKNLEKAYRLRADRIEKQLELRKKIEKIYDEDKKLEIELTKLNIKLKQIESESKQLDLELKRKTMKKYLDRSRDE